MTSRICNGASNGFEDGEDIVVMSFLDGRHDCGNPWERGGRLNNAVGTDIFVGNESPKAHRLWRRRARIHPTGEHCAL